MIQLIITFLISIGFNLESQNPNAGYVNSHNDDSYGVVITDDFGTKSYITLVYDEVTRTFKVR